MRNKTFIIKTFGCKLNFSESSTISRLLSEHGYILLKDNFSSVDFYIINSCAVTEIAEKKCKQVIRHIKKHYPQSKIILLGCFSSLDNAFPVADQVDLMLGSSNKMEILTEIDNLFAENYKHKLIRASDEEAFFSSYSIHERTRSFLKIQDGCDYFCTYCTVPYARGKSRSDTINNIIRYAKEIVANNVKEIVLSGVNIGDFKTDKGENFLDLLTELQKVEHLYRIRISSIEPNLLTEDIINLVLNSDKILPHFHIPLQSGSNEILSKMKRRYTRELFADKVYEIKAKMPYACIVADVIVGFPGETEALFEETCQFISSLPLSMLHVFPYSKRPNTVAANMDDHLPNTCKNKRTSLLIELSKQKKYLFYNENDQQISKVLIENKIENEYLSGFTENYIRVKVPYDNAIINEIKTVKIQKADENGICHAELLEL
ncbi:MAG: tRNA (N(6)-L-threonylcarbamoyladenosine(37)-C(2))-methylthiotransferase MtaB [Bacteroidales bacterium]|jgi:threonylcarbamoyladenosine tRNA methylthiotransferase MtaB|nr:tRNA (N(6)-L-threonylcarbamoyladenosine(37)-C(2))-methylthiotransferase MtaB [Bacteroidales bacterium]